jgi:hypothetical protein
MGEQRGAQRAALGHHRQQRGTVGKEIQPGRAESRPFTSGELCHFGQLGDRLAAAFRAPADQLVAGDVGAPHGPVVPARTLRITKIVDDGAGLQFRHSGSLNGVAIHASMPQRW